MFFLKVRFTSPKIGDHFFIPRIKRTYPALQRHCQLIAAAFFYQIILSIDLQLKKKFNNYSFTMKKKPQLKIPT